jgi:flagellar basal body P-ring formation protein FlgA
MVDRRAIYQMPGPKLLFFVALATAALSTPASAETQGASEIRSAVDAFVRSQTAGLQGRVESVAGTVDPRLKLSLCESLEAFLPTGARLWGNSTVGVRCLHPERWSLFVPVQVRVWADVVVSARALARGQVLAAEDLATQSLDLTQLPQGVYSDPGAVVGKVAGTQIAGGMPLRADMLRTATVVLQGQTVRVVFTGDGLRVTSDGRALGNAGIGEPVQVRTASGKVLKGIVQAAGVVEVR